MTNTTTVTEISRMSIDLEFTRGQPPEEAYRMALAGLFRGLALAVENSNEPKYWFPMFFPLEMTLESEQLHWNFRLVARLKNNFKKKVK